MNNDNQIDELYKVLINIEEQYSFWPINKNIPLGWKETGAIGTKEECDEYVRRVWLDTRPLSLKLAMEEQKAKQTE